MKVTDQELEEWQKQEKQKNGLAHDIGALELRKHKLLNLLDEIIDHQEITFEEIEENYGKMEQPKLRHSYRYKVQAWL